jgi:CheY-like chemotaxis protein
MTTSLRILFIDDDPVFNQHFSGRLAEEGYTVESSLTAPDALRRLDTQPFDLVVLDRKFRGLDTGLDLIGQIRNRAPAAKIILITAYADAASVKRAFDEGVYDYLEKNQFFEAILLIKVRNALEAVRERRFAALANGRREETIRALWQEVQAEKGRKRKGRLLEDLLLVLFKSIPGFESAQPNERSLDEEFDLVVPNESADPFWQKESQYFLVECKHWSAPVDPKEIDRLHEKLARRHGRCQLGFFVALKGFTAGVETALAASRKEPTAIVVLQAPELQRLVEAGPQRNEVLKDIHRKTVIKG